ncbi:MAG: tetratricopeptide repeat protein, partial [Sphingomonadales bacterium]
IQDIAQKLGVGLVLEGSVRKDGNQVRITAQLIDATSGFHLWSENYDRALDNIFAVQDEISAAIVGELKTTMGLTATVRVQNTIPTDPAAYDAYLLGIYEMEKRGPGPLGIAKEQFEKAIAIDPNYAPAIARLSMVFGLLPFYDFGFSFSETLVRAGALADQALSLAPDLPEAQAAKGYYLWVNQRPIEAEPYLVRAIELNPNYSTAKFWLSALYLQLGEFEKNLAILEEVVRDDPLSTIAVANLAGFYIQMGQSGKADLLSERLNSLNPLFNRSLKAQNFAIQGKLAVAAILFLETLEISPGYSGASSGLSSLLGDAFGLNDEAVLVGQFPFSPLMALGRVEEATQKAEVMNAGLGANDLGGKGQIASVYLVAGNLEKASEVIEGAWARVPDRPFKIGSLSAPSRFVFYEIRKQKGNPEGAREIMNLLKNALSAYLDSRFNSYGLVWDQGLVLLYAGRTGEGLEKMKEAVEAGYAPNFQELYLMSRFPDVDFSPVMAALEEKRATERDKFLKIVCNGGNPAPEAWTPMPKTCEGYVESSGE